MLVQSEERIGDRLHRTTTILIYCCVYAGVN